MIALSRFHCKVKSPDVRQSHVGGSLSASDPASPGHVDDGSNPASWKTVAHGCKKVQVIVQITGKNIEKLKVVVFIRKKPRKIKWKSQYCGINLALPLERLSLQKSASHYSKNQEKEIEKALDSNFITLITKDPLSTIYGKRSHGCKKLQVIV